MASIDISQSRAAHHIRLVVHCAHCGHECVEPLSGLHGQCLIVCRECPAPFELKAKDSNILVEELAEVCVFIDARMAGV